MSDSLNSTCDQCFATDHRATCCPIKLLEDNVTDESVSSSGTLSSDDLSTVILALLNNLVNKNETISKPDSKISSLNQAQKRKSDGIIVMNPPPALSKTTMIDRMNNSIMIPEESKNSPIKTNSEISPAGHLVNKVYLNELEKITLNHNSTLSFGQFLPNLQSAPASSSSSSSRTTSISPTAEIEQELDISNATQLIPGPLIYLDKKKPRKDRTPTPPLEHESCMPKKKIQKFEDEGAEITHVADHETKIVLVQVNGAIRPVSINAASTRLRIVTKFDGLKLERPHICCWTLSGSTCGRAFTRSDLLNRHIKSLHTRKKELNCKVEGCDYLCGRSDHLKSHVRNRHKEVYSNFYPADGAGGGSDEAPKKVVKRGQDASQDLGYLGEIQRIKLQNDPEIIQKFPDAKNLQHVKRENTDSSLSSEQIQNSLIEQNNSLLKHFVKHNNDINPELMNSLLKLLPEIDTKMI